LKCDGTRAEARFRLSAKRTSPFKSAGASVQSTTGSRGVPISGSNAGYTMFRGSVKGTGYPLHSPVSPSVPLPCVTVCHHISTGVYRSFIRTCSLHPPSRRRQHVLFGRYASNNLHGALTFHIHPCVFFYVCLCTRVYLYLGLYLCMCLGAHVC